MTSNTLAATLATPGDVARHGRRRAGGDPARRPHEPSAGQEPAVSTRPNTDHQPPAA